MTSFYQTGKFSIFFYQPFVAVASNSFVFFVLTGAHIIFRGIGVEA